MKAFFHLALLVAALASACSSSSQTAPPITGQTSEVTTPPAAPAPAPSAESYGADCAGGKACAAGLTCTTYYGIAGASGPAFHSCEIPCGPEQPKCPDATMCVTIADGPGMVCRPKES